MLATATIELQVPQRTGQVEQGQLQRSLIYHLLTERQITAAEARELLTADERL